VRAWTDNTELLEDGCVRVVVSEHVSTKVVVDRRRAR